MYYEGSRTSGWSVVGWVFKIGFAIGFVWLLVAGLKACTFVALTPVYEQTQKRVDSRTAAALKDATENFRDAAIKQIQTGGVLSLIVTPSAINLAPECNSKGDNCWNTSVTIDVGTPVSVQPGADVQATAAQLGIPTPREFDYAVKAHAATRGPEFVAQDGTPPIVTLSQSQQAYILRVYSVPPYARLDEATQSAVDALPNASATPSE